jgi:hypothetical protein
MELDIARLTTTFLEHWRSFYLLVANRRRFERHELSGDVIATYSNLHYEMVKHRCSGINWSPRGLAVICPEAIPVDAVVQLIGDLGQSAQCGRVRYCYRQYAAFRIGFEFVPPPQTIR